MIGVDSVPSAIRDARANAALNHVTNAEFHCAKAEECMEELLAKHATEGTEVRVCVCVWALDMPMPKGPCSWTQKHVDTPCVCECLPMCLPV